MTIRGEREGFRTGEGLPLPPFVSLSETFRPDDRRHGRERAGALPASPPAGAGSPQRPAMRGHKGRPLPLAQGSRYAAPALCRVAHEAPKRPLTARHHLPAGGGQRPAPHRRRCRSIAFSLWNTYLFRKLSGRPGSVACALPRRAPASLPPPGRGPSSPIPSAAASGKAIPSPVPGAFPQMLPFPAPKEAP